MTDEQMLLLLKSDPERGLRELMREHTGLVCGIVRNRVGGVCGERDIEECVSDIFTAFYCSLARVDTGRGSVRGWLCAIAKNKASDLYRRVVRTGASLDDEGLNELPFDGITPEQSAIDAESRRELVDAIASLPDIDREIIVRKFYYREPSKNIARRLGITVSAVDTRTHRALKKLRDVLGGK